VRAPCFGSCQLARRAGDLAHGHGLTRQQRLIRTEIGGRKQDGIRGHTVTLTQHNDVVAHHLAASNSALLGISDNQRPWTGEISQRLQRVFGSALLIELDANDESDRRQQQHRLRVIAEHNVSAPAASSSRIIGSRTTSSAVQ
jgi:hypothetical protein